MGGIKLGLIFLMAIVLSACASFDLDATLGKIGWRNKTTENNESVSNQRQNDRTMSESDKLVLSSKLSNVDDFLTYFQQVSTLSSAKKDQELRAVSVSYQKEKDVIRGLRYALILLVADGDRAGNQKKALFVLEEVQNEVLKKRSDTQLTPLIHLVWNLVRMSDEYQAEAAELKKQISALKSIEKSIHEREVGTGTNK